MQLVKWISIALVAVTATGCASKRVEVSQSEMDSFEHYERIVQEEYQRMGEILTRSAILSSKSMAVLARTKQGHELQNMTSEEIRLLRWQHEYIPTNMEMTISDFAWDGPPEPVLRRMAAAASYEIQFINERPPISPAVTISPGVRNIKNYIFSVLQQSQTQGYIDKIYIDDRTDRRLITVYYGQF